MMQNYWNDTQDNKPRQLHVPDEIADLSFKVECRGGLAIDHAYALYQEISHTLLWFETAANIALHTLHGAASGNGWMRPYQDNELLFLSKRTRLRLRLPKSRFEDAMVLTGQALKIGDCIVNIKRPTIRALSTQTSLFTRSLVSPNTLDENEFLHYAANLLGAQAIHPQRMMGGRQHTIKMPTGTLYARSLMIVDLSFEESIRLQQNGLGDKQKLGCGIFLAHKSIAAIYQSGKMSHTK